MRVMQLGGFYMGAQRVIEYGIHCHLKANGHESCILYEYGNADDGEIQCYENRLENLFTRGMRKVFGKDYRFAAIQTLRILRKIDQWKPDVVHLHVVHDGCIDYAALLNAIIIRHIPVVYTMHDMWAWTGGCYHYDQEGCSGFTSGCQSCPAEADRLDCRKSDVPRLFETKKRLLMALPSLTCVTVSNWVLDELKKGFLANRSSLVIYNGVEPFPMTLPETQGSHQKHSYRLISVAAWWNASKGYERLIKLACHLGSEYELLLVGHVPDDLRAKAPVNVNFYGFCNDRVTLINLFRSSDLHISASYEETFGMTFVEAAMVGTRSIGFNSTAIGEILSMVGGVIVDELTPEALAEAVRETINHDRCRLSQQEVSRISAYFSMERMAKEYASVYEKVIREVRKG